MTILIEVKNSTSKTARVENCVYFRKPHSLEIVLNQIAKIFITIPF